MRQIPVLYVSLLVDSRVHYPTLGRCDRADARVAVRLIGPSYILSRVALTAPPDSAIVTSSSSNDHRLSTQHTTQPSL